MNFARFIAPTLACAIATTLAAPAAFASSMPKADFTRNNLGLGLGNGLHLSLDFPVGGNLALGGAIGANNNFTGSDLDLHLMYKLINGGRNRFMLDLLGGVEFYGSTLGQFGNFAPMVGVAMAYPFTNQLTGRLNLVTSFGSGFGYFGGFAPSGIELGYKFTSNLEGTIGGNGRGDFLGLNLLF